ncbi:exopolysaccharide biosynthesis protein [Algicella marina]|uniref:Exopolysaccharide biosynthesis protein exod n=1 Tax=Algicella marina TaxID=2683284 RepID=A0A6P1T003_9RHOB|nr:exopolysaccharide biosynthesis protein [Algicella marina]QHQ35041.1 hypothetical protein GO499_07450 [Algicella marina]
MGNSSLDTFINDLNSAADGEKTSIGEILDAIGSRSFGPLLMALGLASASPIGAIPLATPIIVALTLIVAGQILVGCSHIWVPDRLCRQEMSSDKLSKTADYIQTFFNWISVLTSERLSWMLDPPMPRVAALVAILLALSMLPVILIPGGVLPASVALAFIGLGMTTRDGLILLVTQIAALVILAGTVSVLL